MHCFTVVCCEFVVGRCLGRLQMLWALLCYAYGCKLSRWCFVLIRIVRVCIHAFVL